MSSVVLINNQEVSFEVVGDQTYTTSLAISNVFEKRHDNIIAQIRALPNDEFHYLNFKETYRDTKISGFNRVEGATRKDPFYNLTRDGFSLIVT
ncbi:hypothetical protein GO117_02985 [Campylobacter fetus]|nr:hypothetical protein [Campylobacter fetus]EJU9540101.1 Rha family transcriptional regulator [Campylobacter fetus]